MLRGSQGKIPTEPVPHNGSRVHDTDVTINAQRFWRFVEETERDGTCYDTCSSTAILCDKAGHLSK